MKPASRALVAAFVVLSTLALPGAPAEEDGAVPCPGFTVVPGQGPSCPEGGLWRVLLDDGTSLLTHGPDTFASLGLDGDGAESFDAAPAEPACVPDPATDHHMLLIYARPHDKPDRYAEMAPQIRDLVANANGLLREEAARFGVTANYKVRCEGGVVVVKNETLPTGQHSDGWSSITSDLRNKGYTSIRVKHWVWYDDGVGGNIAGQGSIYDDDRLILENHNNAAPDTQASFGITYGTLSTRTMMHENGHNLGAVQLSSPHTSGAWHCDDGLDIMCYADGGSGSNYNPNVCATQRFDCNGDDYFHPSPPAGSYLATHWNLGSTLSRFILFGDEFTEPVNQPPSAAFAATCRALACDVDASSSSDADGLIAAYAWDWGDASPAGSGRAASHTYAAAGTYTITLTVTDDGGLTGSASRVVTPGIDSVPPVTTHALSGTAGTGGWYRSDVTATLSATDNDAGVAETRYRLDGGAWETYSGPVRVSSEGAHVLEYASRDAAGNEEAPKSVAFGVDRTAPSVVNVAPDGGVYVNGMRVPGVALPPGKAIVAEARPVSLSPLESRFRVESDAWDAHSGVQRVDVYGGLLGVDHQCTDAAGSGARFACEWVRDPTERGRQVMRVVARDLAGNQASVTVEVYG